jgi:hypothetical protein
LATGPFPHQGRVPVPPADCLGLQLPGVPVPRGLAITPSLPRKGWVSPVRRVLAPTALGPEDHDHPLAAVR